MAENGTINLYSFLFFFMVVKLFDSEPLSYETTLNTIQMSRCKQFQPLLFSANQLLSNSNNAIIPITLLHKK